MPGDRLLEAVAVMDRLRSPGGCPWDAEQTHASLLRYLIEECYELVQAVEDGEPAEIREELGDVLLQVLFHARIAAERPREAGGFDVDDVAGDLVDKLVRRHPHVFGSEDQGQGRSEGESHGEAAVAGHRAAVATAADQQDRWDELKRVERGDRGLSSALDGVALGQPALALAGKLGARATKYAVPIDPPAGATLGEELFRVAYAAGARGEDPESALRDAARRFAAAMAAAERAADARPGDERVAG